MYLFVALSVLNEIWWCKNTSSAHTTNRFGKSNSAEKTEVI